MPSSTGRKTWTPGSITICRGGTVLNRSKQAISGGRPWDRAGIARAGVIVVIAADYSRTTVKYGERGRRYVAIEAGHAAQNIYLQAVALGLGATEVGAFRDSAVARLVALPRDQVPVTSVIVGRPQG